MSADSTLPPQVKDEESSIDVPARGLCGGKRFLSTYTPMLILFFFSVCTGAGPLLISPLLPFWKKEYFGSDQKAAQMQSIVDSAAALLMLLTAALYGQLMDHYGRRPFFIAAAIAYLVPFIFLLLWQHNPWPYMISTGVFEVVQASYMNAYICDRYPPSERIYVMNFIAATVPVPMALLLLFGKQLSFYSGTWICAGMFVPTIFIAVFFVKESLEESTTMGTITSALSHPFSSISVLTRSKVAIGLVFIFALAAIANAGAGEIFIYYLNQRINYTVSDYRYTVIEDLLMRLLMLIVVPVLLRYFSLSVVMVVGLVALLLEVLFIASVWAVWPVFVIGVPANLVAAILQPATAAYIANVGRNKENGIRMTALSAVGDFCTTVGDLFFGQLYAALNGGLVFIPFIIIGALTAAATGLALRVPHWEKQEARGRLINIPESPDDTDEVVVSA